jgi:septal ring factor EnvC (AmiA/AmiB activator)
MTISDEIKNLEAKMKVLAERKAKLMENLEKKKHESPNSPIQKGEHETHVFGEDLSDSSSESEEEELQTSPRERPRQLAKRADSLNQLGDLIKTLSSSSLTIYERKQHPLSPEPIPQHLPLFSNSFSLFFF